MGIPIVCSWAKCQHKIFFKSGLNSVDRTLSFVRYKAKKNKMKAYRIFKDMVQNALTSSLIDMIDKGVERAVMSQGYLVNFTQEYFVTKYKTISMNFALKH